MSKRLSEKPNGGQGGKRPKSVGSVDIARFAGVARSTVSKVLNGYPHISDTTRARVLTAVRKHQYYPDLSAQILAGKRTNTLGLFFINPGHFSEDLLVNFMISRVIESAAALGHHMLTYIIREPDDPEALDSVREVFHQRRISGGVFIGAKDREPIIEELVAEGFVIGVLDESPRGRSEENRVLVNFADDQAAAKAIEYLASLGHRRIALIHGDMRRNGGRAKKRGFERALRTMGAEIRDEWSAYGQFSGESGYRAMNELIERSGLRRGSGTGREVPTALACANDNTAFGAMRAAEDAGIRIPEDLSVIGIDGHPLGAYVRPPLTTFVYDFSSMMRSLIEGVIGVAEGNETQARRSRVFSATLTERGSCAPMNQRR